MKGVKMCLSKLGADIFDTEVHNLIPWYDMWLSAGGDNFEE
jgi:hypothetical protein